MGFISQNDAYIFWGVFTPLFFCSGFWVRSGSFWDGVLFVLSRCFVRFASVFRSFLLPFCLFLHFFCGWTLLFSWFCLVVLILCVLLQCDRWVNLKRPAFAPARLFAWLFYLYYFFTLDANDEFELSVLWSSSQSVISCESFAECFHWEVVKWIVKYCYFCIWFGSTMF